MADTFLGLEPKLRNLLNEVFRDGYSIEEERCYEFRGKYYYLDYVVKRNNIEIAVIEVKRNIENSSQYIHQAKLIQDLFLQTSPLIIFVDGEKEMFYIWEDEGLRSILQSELSDLVDNKDVPIPKPIDEERFVECLITINNKLDNRLSSFANKIIEKNKKGLLGSILVQDGRSFSFNEEYETDFFLELLNNCVSKDNPFNNLYKYTTFDTLHKMIEGDKQGLASIICMNDKTECYYADNYLSHIDNTSSAEAKDVTPNYYKESEYYILSCVNNEKERLFMWNMYGEKGFGVRIQYQLKSEGLSNSFIVAQVDYAEDINRHTTLDNLHTLLTTEYGLNFKFSKWNVWKHFFKPYEFSEEKEIRILYYKDEYNNSLGVEWISRPDMVFPLLQFEMSSFPYAIHTIVLGPKINRKMNVEMLKKFLKHLGNKTINVEPSSIKSI